MDSDFYQNRYQHHFQEFSREIHQPKKPQTHNLTRFCSAPSSYFASFLDVAAETINTTGGATGGGGERRDYPNARPLSPETENIFNNFMSSIGAENNNSQKLSNVPENTAVQQAFPVRVKQETDFQPQQQPPQQQLQQANYNSQSQMVYHSHSKPPLSNQHKSAASSAMPSSFSASTRGIAVVPQMKTGLGGGNNNRGSSLTRYSSSPAGFFDNLNIDTLTAGYGLMGSTGPGNYGSGNEGKVQINYSSSEQISTSDLMNQNSDVATKIRRMNSLDEGQFNNQNNDKSYGYPMTSWDDSIMSENFSSADDCKPFTELTSSEYQSEEGKNRPPRLTHHLSLPKTLPEMSDIENFLLSSDTVPCRVRAKRGCATHPRSIAERVRRTKISERMRKLQDLVPNMDKQTNTADMLDLAVDYIKDLQKQVETLNDDRALCTCSK